MVFITVEAYKDAEVHTITVKNKYYFWVKIVDVQKKSGQKNLSDMARKEICCRLETTDPTKTQKRKYIRSEFEILEDFGDIKSKYARNYITEKIIKNCRGVNDCINRLDKQNQRENFRQLLGFKENEIYESNDYSVVKQVKKVFKRQKIIEQYKAEKYFIDLSFPVHNLRGEIDKNGHTDRSKINEEKREETIK